MIVFSFKKNNNFLSYVWWLIYIKENVPNILSRYISANARFPYKDRYWITAYRYYDLLSGKAIYAIPLYVSGTRPKGGEKESPSFPSPEDRNARTPSINCTFARPILDLSRRGSNPHDFPLYISIIFRTIDQSMFIVFLLFSFAPGGSVVPLLFAF